MLLFKNRQETKQQRTVSATTPASASGNSAFALTDNRVVQRKITMAGDATVYNNAAQVPLIRDRILAENGEWKNEYGNTLAGMLRRGDHGPYANYTALLADIAAKRQHGIDANAIGNERELNVAAATGAVVADMGRYGQDLTVHLNGSDRHVKLDVLNAHVYGIVGGAAKAKNLVKFRGICRDLKVISAQDGRTPRVYCDANTPESVAVAAREIIGAGNVINSTLNKPWDFHKGKKRMASALLGSSGAAAIAALGFGAAGWPLALAAGAGALGGYLIGRHFWKSK